MVVLNEHPVPCTLRKCAPGAVPFGMSIDPANAPDASAAIVPIGCPSNDTCSVSLGTQPEPRKPTSPPTGTVGFSTTISPLGGYCEPPPLGAVVGGGVAPPVPPVPPLPPGAGAPVVGAGVGAPAGRSARPAPMPAIWSRRRLPVMNV